jgi:hypothetical protein
MPEEKAEIEWIKLEYENLRNEILALSEREGAAPQFFIPAGAVVYAVPYLLKQTEDAFLWCLCVGVAGLLVLAMSHVLYACVDGIRKLGMYIKVGIEPRTCDGMRWEGVVHQWDLQSNLLYSDTFAMAAGAAIANVAVAIGVAFSFLQGRARWAPIVVVALITLVTIPSIYKISQSARSRERYAKDVKDFLKNINKDRQPCSPEKAGKEQGQSK